MKAIKKILNFSERENLFENELLRPTCVEPFNIKLGVFLLFYAACSKCFASLKSMNVSEVWESLFVSHFYLKEKYYFKQNKLKNCAHRSRFVINSFIGNHSTIVSKFQTLPQQPFGRQTFFNTLKLTWSANSVRNLSGSSLSTVLISPPPWICPRDQL